MKNITTIAAKELYTYFVSPVAYFVLIIFIVVSGVIFSLILLNASVNSYPSALVMESTFNSIRFILLFFAPAMTMKLFAEERKSGTIELLLTSPITDIEVVFGKFLAGWLLLVIMLILTLLFPILIIPFGNLEIGPIISGYLGLLLLGSTFISLGVMISSMSKNQIVFALVSFGLLLLLSLIDPLSNLLGNLGGLLAYFSLIKHFPDFARGIVSLKHVVYYLSFTMVCLFVTVKSVESSKWR
jgi:ABC-2 type transport system permease protein